MKKIVATMLALVMSVSLNICNAFADNNDVTITFEKSDYSVNVGDEFDVNVLVTDNALGFNNVTMALEFDPNVIQPQKLDKDAENIIGISDSYDGFSPFINYGVINGQLAQKNSDGKTAAEIGLLKFAAYISSVENYDGRMVLKNVEGTGVLVGFKFKAVGSGTSKLEIAASPTSNFKLADSEMRISGCKASVTVGGDDKSSEETTKVASSSSSSEETPEETTSSDVTTIAEVTTASEKVTETTTEITTVVETDDVKTTFNDIQNYPWAVDFIENLAAQKIINGYSDGSFKPADNIKRADFVMMLMKAIGEDVSNTNGKSFDDVDSGAYYAGAVCTAKNLGIANGNGDGTFSPSSNITRQDMMLLAKNAIEYKTGKKTEGNVSVLDGFNDKAEISAYAQNGLAAMVEAGIINGTGKSIEPKANTTRAQAAVVIYKIINYKA